MGIRKGGWLLYNQIPVIGGWLRRQAANKLAQLASPNSSAALAEAVAHSDDPEVRQISARALTSRKDQATIDSVCGEWAATRSSTLLELIEKYKWLPSQPEPVRLLIALKTGQATIARGIGPDTVPNLIRYCSDQDKLVTQNARKTIASLANQESIDCVCSQWVESRDAFLDRVVTHAKYVATKPPYIRVLTALRNGVTTTLESAAAEVVEPLINAQYDPISSEISSRATNVLTKLKNKSAINRLCTIWADSRDLSLNSIIESAGYIATEPERVRLLTALLNGKQASLKHVNAKAVIFLFEACKDQSKTISGNAKKALYKLKDAAAKDEVCRRGIYDDDDFAIAIAKKSNYAPSDEHERALFYFLTQQWNEYEDFDFDHRLLQAVYSTASTELKTRITESIRQSGRTEYLSIISQSAAALRADTMTGSEIGFAIQMLVKSKDWSRLWAMALEVSLIHSVLIIRVLAKSNWRPDRPDDLAALSDLTRICQGELPESAEQITPYLPPAAFRAKARVSGRVGDVAFSPTLPWIAIAGKHQVVIWDFQKGKQHASMRGFRRSVGAIAFTQRNQMVCVEGMQHGIGSILHSWEAGTRNEHEHPDMITALSPVKDSIVLVSRYDKSVSLWDARSNTIQKERQLGFWPRSSRVNSESEQALLLHEGASLIDLRDLTIQSGTTGKIGGGVSRCAAFAPDGKSFLIGNFNGRIFVANRRANSLAIRRRRFADADGQAQGIEVVNGQPVVAVAGANGRVDFISTENEALIGSVLTTGERLTSMHVSPSGEFMALGDSDSTMTFWDLRVLHVPMLLTLPFAKSRPLHLAAVEGLAGDRSLPASVKRAVEFMARILRHRFRYDIEIGEVQAIRAGEFDIEID